MFTTIIPQMSLLTLTKNSTNLNIYSSVHLIRGFCTSLGIMEKPIVALPGLGTLQGCTTESAFTKKKIYQFLGVRYAESPTGERRFKAPVPAEPWDGIKRAEKYGRPSIAYRNIGRLPKEEITEKLEDCLNLCVYSNNLSVKKPVMVYIHGGGFYEGSAQQYAPTYLLEKDIVLVVPQFRLGPLGFLSTKSEAIPGNAAMLDVLLALEWVQKYISNFGGDPDCVTLVGQSAGASMVSAMALSSAVPENLFHKVILQSGSSMSTWTFDVNPEKNARDILNRAGFEDSAKMSIDEINKCFMDMDALTLMQSHNEHMVTGTINGINTIGGHRLTIGGPTQLFPKNAYELRRSCKYRKNLPMLAGACKNDASFGIATIYDYLQATFGLKNQNFNSFQLIDAATRIMGCEDITGGLPGLASHIYFTPEQLIKGNFRELANGIFDFTNATIIKGPILRAVQANAQFNAENTYLYSFDYKGEHTRFTGNFGDASLYPFNAGVAHSDDNIYLYPHCKTNPNLNVDDVNMVKRMTDLWTSFIIDGKPKSSDMTVAWPPLTKVVGPYLHINKECTIGENYIDEYSVISREAHEPRFRQQSYAVHSSATTATSSTTTKNEENNKVNEFDETLFGKITKEKLAVM